MRCYYEVLEVPRNVESSELKKAYYKLSLQWHPDKNSSSGDTTAVFQDIQEAYRVLSDPHERAWYDSHRSQILQSGNRKIQVGPNSDYEEERLDVFQYFTRSCFQGFGDDEKGFYSVYRKVFEQLHEEELRASTFDSNGFQPSASDDTEEDVSLVRGNNSHPYPTFGTSDSSYTKVVAPFYRFWEMFQTKKSYTWVEKYDTRCAESRSERRAMEAQNRRLRTAARKKRNEEIHELVSYVKRRDKRVIAERERVQAVRQEAQVRSQHMARNARMREAVELAQAWDEERMLGGLAAQWTQAFEEELARLEAEMDGLSVDKNDERADELFDPEQLYCLACDKAFASVKAKQNHEFSKKHRKQTELLRHVLLSQEIAAMQSCSQSPSDNTPCEESDLFTSIDCDSTPVVEVKLTKRAKKAQRKRLKEAEKQASAQHISVDSVECCCITADVSLEPGSGPDSQTPTEPAPSSPPPPTTVPEVAHSATWKCDTCDVVFPSRNKLFTHLKETNHATLKSVTTKSSNRKRNTQRRR